MAKQGAKMAVPRLRFPKFRKDVWDYVPGDELFDQINNREADAGLPILAITQEHGAIPRDLIDYHVSVTDKSIESYKVVDRGDFIISLRSFQGGIEYSNYRGICSPAYVILRRKGKGADQYFKQLFKSNRFIQQMTRNIEGLRDGKMISYKQFSEQMIPTPSIKEQQQIADCLTSLDEVITAQGRKVEALKTHKRGLMQQLFPREGETRPRLRFPEFRNAAEWEQKLGGALFDNRKEGGEEGLPIYSVTVNDGMIPRASFDRDFYDIEDPAKNKKACKGDIAYNMMRMWQGAQGVAVEDCIVSPAYVVLSPVDGVCSSFFAYLFKLTQSLELLTAYSRGLTQDRLRLYFEDFARMPLCVPRHAEQQRIANFLSSLDAQIAAESDQLAALKTHKQGLMQQLFPAQGAG